MGWFDSLFGRRLRPANELFAGFRRKSLAPIDLIFWREPRKKLERAGIC